MRTLPRLIALAAPLLLAACGAGHDDGPVRVDVIGTRDQFAHPLDNGGNAGGQVVLAAADQGLVAFDAGGALIGGLAERWIVEDDGRSLLFRLKRARWADGRPVKADEVARLLRARFRANPAILAGIEPEVQGMTDEVVEIRLPGSTPGFLQMLAHPALGIARPGGGTGPFRKSGTNGMLTLRPAESTPSDPEDAGSHDATSRHPLFLRAVTPALGFVRFVQRQSDLMLGGRFQHLPYITIASPPGNSVRADPVSGLFGFAIEGRSDFLADHDVRTALAMAIDRGRIAQQFNLAGWRTVTTILPAQLDLDRPPSEPGWAAGDLDQRRASARLIVALWRRGHGAPPRLRIALPDGPGARLLFRSVADDLAAIGVPADPVGSREPADLRLIDEVAPFDSALWYLARLGCGLNALCNREAEGPLAEARAASDDESLAVALDKTEPLILAEANYIPIGMPVRFALVRNRLTGYALSPRGRHPLNALFRAPR